MAATITLPPVQDYRDHLGLVISYIMLHISVSKIEGFPDFDLERMVNYEKLEKFRDKLMAAKPTKPLKVTLKEMLRLYTCFSCMNKILVSDYDELMAPHILNMLPNDHPLKEFKTFRNEMIRVNCHLIENTETNIFKNQHAFTAKQISEALDDN
jgi:hypothetical protein